MTPQSDQIPSFSQPPRPTFAQLETARHGWNCPSSFPYCKRLYMFSQTVEYALRAMVQLTYAAPEASSTDDLAGFTQVPRAYLSKVLQELRRAGLVESRRGIGGGITLAREPSEISILDIVSAVDPIRRIATCPLGLKSHGTRLCPLHGKLDNALAEIESTFAETSLADIVAAPHHGSKPLCDSIVDANG